MRYFLLIYQRLDLFSDQLRLFGLFSGNSTDGTHADTFFDPFLNQMHALRSLRRMHRFTSRWGGRTHDAPPHTCSLFQTTMDYLGPCVVLSGGDCSKHLADQRGRTCAFLSFQAYAILTQNCIAVIHNLASGVHGRTIQLSAPSQSKIWTSSMQHGVWLLHVCTMTLTISSSHITLAIRF